MQLPNDHDIRTPLEDDELSALPEDDAAGASGEQETSEIARRLNVLGKLIIPPTTHR